jgi:diguanylate cyclase (GGDEF)-like protein
VDARDVSDVTSIAGLDETELTPNVRAAITGLMAEVDRLRQELNDAKARNAYLEKLADEDALMPVANRRAFVRELSRLMSFAERYGSPSSVIYFDINGMKRINDTHGHAAGDAALFHVAKLLVDNVRSSDVVGRLGGDEFGVLLVQTDQSTAEVKAAKLAETIGNTAVPWNSVELTVTAAWGVHTFAGQENAAQALDAADRAMYRRKNSTRS